MSLVGSGAHNDFAFGVPSDSKSADGYKIVSKMTEIPVDAKNISCVATSWQHTVIVTKDGRVLAAGDDTEFRIGSENRKIYEEFTEIEICDELIVWAAAGDDFTLYLTESWRVILCHCKAIGQRINVSLTKRAVSVFGGREYGAIIDEEGSVYLIDRENPRSVPEKFSFPSPAIEVACCQFFCAVLLNDRTVYGNGELNGKNREFCLVPSLRNQKITKISGYISSCLALNEAGSVFTYGRNIYGQLGDGTTTDNYSSFKAVSSLKAKRVKDVACSGHSLFLTEDDELYGCGWNKYSQLFKQTNNENVLTPILLSKDKNFSSIFAGIVYSLALCGFNVESPTRIIFSQSTGLKLFEIRRALQHKNINTNIINDHHDNNIVQEIVGLKRDVRQLKDEIGLLKQNFQQTSNQISEVSNQIKEMKELLVKCIDLSGVDQW